MKLVHLVQVRPAGVSRLAVSYPRKVREFAFRMYLDGSHTKKDIAEAILDKYDLPVSEGAINDWARVYNWKAKKDEANVTALEKVANGDVARRVLQTEDQIENYDEIRGKAMEALDDLGFKSAEGAAAAVDMAIKGARSIEKGLLSAQLVSEVVKIIVEEVKDPELRERLGTRMSSLVGQIQEGNI